MTEEEDLKLSHTALTVLRQRYLKKDETREIIETPVEMFHRVAKHVAEVEKKLASDVDITALEEEFF
ncbi:MAG: ribonucleotide reductase N-terminal alpha domain-containing protein, partial [Candidatus Helarchaeota archaeon]